jgi:uncharacterized damage-inducible protein DinB
MRFRPALVPALALLFAAPALARAQDTDPASVTGVRKELIQQLGDAEQKLVALAEATPAERYGWRPAAGVRSTSEVYMHMVGANFMFPGIAGVTRAPGVALSRDMETKVTDKAQVIDLLRKSFAYARQGVADVPDDQLDAMVKMFGQPSTKRGVLVLMATHAHEHLGQSIAYARMGGIVPPWSRGNGGGQ